MYVVAVHVQALQLMPLVVLPRNHSTDRIIEGEAVERESRDGPSRIKEQSRWDARSLTIR